MSILLDPNKSFVSIDIYYIEEIKTHGNSIFHFIKSQDDFSEWKRKGYRTLDELTRLQAEAQSKDEEKKAETIPGAPISGAPISGAPVSGASYDATKVIQKLVTQWKRMTWKDSNAVFSKSLKTIPQADGRTLTELDTIRYRDMKLKTCLKKWDLQDEAGQEVPCSEDNIDILEPSVAAEMLSSFEKVTEATEDEKKD